MYILPANGSHGDIGQLRDTLGHISHHISCLVWIHHSVEQRCIYLDADVVFGVDHLVAHVDYSCFEVDCVYSLSAKVVVV